jgi:hypothetical protein
MKYNTRILNNSVHSYFLICILYYSFCLVYVLYGELSMQYLITLMCYAALPTSTTACQWQQQQQLYSTVKGNVTKRGRISNGHVKNKSPSTTISATTRRGTEARSSAVSEPSSCSAMVAPLGHTHSQTSVLLPKILKPVLS